MNDEQFKKLIDILRDIGGYLFLICILLALLWLTDCKYACTH